MAREVLKKSRVARRAISILAVLGVCMVMSGRPLFLLDTMALN